VNPRSFDAARRQRGRWTLRAGFTAQNAKVKAKGITSPLMVNCRAEMILECGPVLITQLEVVEVFAEPSEK